MGARAPRGHQRGAKKKKERERKRERKKEKEEKKGKKKERKVNQHDERGAIDQFQAQAGAPAGKKSSGAPNWGGDEGNILQLCSRAAKINDSLGPRVGDLLDTPLIFEFLDILLQDNHIIFQKVLIILR